MKYNTIIFDLDGTLLNTLDDLMNSVNFALDKYGFPHRNIEEIQTFVGNGVAKLVELSVPKGTAEEVTAELLEIFKEHYKENSMVKTAPYEGVIEMLDEVNEAGIKTAVVTNKMQEAAVDVVRHYFGDRIKGVIGQVDGLPQKPAPDGVWRAIEKLNSKLEDSVYIGDSEVDCATAHNANLPIIGCTWGFRDKSVLEQNKAEYIIDKPCEILPIVLGQII